MWKTKRLTKCWKLSSKVKKPTKKSYRWKCIWWPTDGPSDVHVQHSLATRFHVFQNNYLPAPWHCQLLVFLSNRITWQSFGEGHMSSNFWRDQWLVASIRAGMKKWGKRTMLENIHSSFWWLRNFGGQTDKRTNGPTDGRTLFPRIFLHSVLH